MGPGQAIDFCSLCPLLSRLELFTQPLDLIRLLFLSISIIGGSDLNDFTNLHASITTSTASFFPLFLLFSFLPLV